MAWVKYRDQLAFLVSHKWMTTEDFAGAFRHAGETECKIRFTNGQEITVKIKDLQWDSESTFARRTNGTGKTRRQNL